MLRTIALRLACFFLLFLPLSHPILAESNFTKRHDVQIFIQQMVKKHGFKQQTLVNLFNQVKMRQEVIRQINKPLEKETWRLYQSLFVSEWRIQHGVTFWNKYATALKAAEKIYGVPASIIVATIGIETRYGEKQGEYRVMDSLTNLAFSHSTRAPFFRKELEQFLLLTREQHLDPLKIMGSYAGAIGQPQFMPSSYRYYAVNFSKSGKTDLMNNEVDVIGSIANYYKLHGWKTHAPIALQAVIVGERYHNLKHDHKPSYYFTLDQLAKYGIMPKEKMAKTHLKVKIIELNNQSSKEYWLGFPNFYVIRRYNASDLYAMAVYQLSSHITTLRNRLNHET